MPNLRSDQVCVVCKRCAHWSRPRACLQLSDASDEQGNAYGDDGRDVCAGDGDGDAHHCEIGGNADCADARAGAGAAASAAACADAAAGASAVEVPDRRSVQRLHRETMRRAVLAHKHANLCMGVLATLADARDWMQVKFSVDPPLCISLSLCLSVSLSLRRSVFLSLNPCTTVSS
eukprot:307628-Pleurochrysis_carterae.AAC.1